MPEQKLYIGNLPYRTTEGDVREYFRGYGPIYSVILIYNPETRRTRGYGFVELEDSAAEAVLRELNDTKFMGRNLKIRKANIKEDTRYEEKNPQTRAADMAVPPSKTIAERFDCGNTAIHSVNDGNLSGSCGEYGDFKQKSFKSLLINKKYYDIECYKYGLYHSYKVKGNQIKYSGPSNFGTTAER
jgi:RNA recognition motif-containing protein